MFYSIQKPTTSIASLSQQTSTNEPPTQFESIKEITRNEIDTRKLLQGLATGGIATSV